MQNMSFYIVSEPLPYFTYISMTPFSSQISTLKYENDHNSMTSCFFPSNLQNYCRLFEYLTPNNDSSNSIGENKLGEDIQINSASCEILQADSRLSQTTSPIILCYNGESSKLMEKQEQVSLDSLTLNRKQKINQCCEKAKSIKIEEDKQYFPQLDRKRKCIQKYQQNQNRNIIPNEINQIFSFIQKKNKSGHIVEKLFKKYSHASEFTPKRFYLYQSLLKNKLGHYTNEKSLKLVTELYEPKCQSWSEQEQRYYNKICRILIHHFMQQDSIFIILTSKRMKQDKKYDHLRARRQVSSSVLPILKGY